MHAINIVATIGMIKKFFPGAREPHHAAVPGIMSASFPVDPEKCQTKLGRFLAENISTTRLDDDGSRVRLLLPITEAGARLSHIMQHLQETDVRHKEVFTSIIEKVRTELDALERLHDMYGSALFERRVEQFTWPVFGSLEGGIREGVDTPEKFFDFCARKIRRMGAVVLSAGLLNARPPESWVAS